VGSLKAGLFTLIFIHLTIATFAFAESDDYSYQTFSPQCSVRAELYDPQVMAQTMANPEKLKKFMSVMSQPETMQIMMSCASNPEQWTAWMSKISDPNKMANTMMVFMNPHFYFTWMTTFMNPHFYNPT
tara:strand:+ start:1793 stop:2179 length:387 start_codon:yes stop_codon:yes gene_type:complete